MARLKGPTQRIAHRVKSSSIKCSPFALIIHGRKWNMKTLEIHFFSSFFKRRRSPFVVPATAIFTSNYFRTPGRENCRLPTVYGFIVSKFFSKRKRVFIFCSFHSCCKIRLIPSITGPELI